MVVKKEILLIAGGVASLAVLAVAAYLLYGGISEFAQTEQELRQAKTALEGSYARDPFPSTGNVALEQRNVETLSNWFGRVTAALREGQAVSGERSPSIFMGMLGAFRTRLQTSAATNGTALAESEFGFGRYFVQGSPLPAPDEVPRLTEQMMIIEGICALLFGEKVSSLDLVQREEFEGGGGVETPQPAAPASRPIRSAGGPAAPASSARDLPARADAGMIEEGEVFGRYRFVLDLTAREAVLMRVLNRIASHKMFIVVTGVQADKTDQELRPAPPLPDKSAEPNAEQTPVVGLYKRERLVCGPQLEQPMRVKIRLDVYKFKES